LAEENETKVENNTPTAEDYEALKAELEAEKQKAQTMVSEATQALTERVATLEADLTAKTGELETIQGQLAEATTNFDGAKAAYAYAVEDYRKLVLQTNPLFTPDIIGGDTIDAVKASVEKAGVLVSKVKEGLEAQASALSQLSVVPAGAPARGQINTEGLSAKEKINLGLEQARKKKEA
jgi:chromosome segregation ATPase